MAESRGEQESTEGRLGQNENKAKEPKIIDTVRVIKDDGSAVFEAKSEAVQPLASLKAVTYDSKGRVKEVNITPRGGKIDKAA